MNLITAYYPNEFDPTKGEYATIITNREPALWLYNQLKNKPLCGHSHPHLINVRIITPEHAQALLKSDAIQDHRTE